MTDRTVSVKLRAEISSYMASLQSAGLATRKLASDVTQTQRQFEMADRKAAQSTAALGRELQKHDRKMAESRDHVGKGLLAAGTVAVAAAGLAAKAAIEWETAWAGVSKTVDGSEAQMASLEGQLRGLATSLPASHEEIAAVAEAAGQLGIERENVASFTKVMIDLGETTNLTADAAATAIAQISNVMGTSQDDVDRFGSALVALGNDGASTEAEILSMAQRIAGAANVVGMSETDVLGMASALASVGIEAEEGGSSISNVMMKIASAVSEGGDSLEGFAKVAGMTNDEFASLFQDDSAAAIATFVEGLGRMQKSGEDVFTVLNDLGLSDIRVRRAMLNLAGAGDLLRESLDLGGKAWKDNTALTDEAQKRYDTAAAQIQVAFNNVKDVAIDVGAAIVPILTGIADVVGFVAGVFGDLPGPVQEGLGLIAGLAGVAAIAAGGLLLLAPKVAKTKEAIRDLGWNFGGTAKKASLLGGALGVVAIADAALSAALRDTPADIEAMAGGLEKWAKGGKLAGEAARILGADTSALREALSDVSDTGFSRVLAEAAESVPILGTALAGTDDSLTSSVERIGALDSALAQMVSSGNFMGAAQGFDQVSRLAQEQGIHVGQLIGMLPQYAAEMEKAGRAVPKGASDWLIDAGIDVERFAGKATQSAAQIEKEYSAKLDKMGRKSGEVAVQVGDATDAIAMRFGVAGESAEESAKAVQKMFDEWAEGFASFVPMIGAYEEALAKKQEAEQKSAENTADSTKGSSDSWGDFAGEVALTVDEYLAQLERMTKDQDEWSGNMIDLAGRIPDEMLNELATLGTEGAGMVALLNKMTDKELKIAIDNFEATGLQAGQKFSQQLAEAGPVLRKIADDLGQGTADKITEGMKKRGTSVYEEAKRQGVLIDRGVDINKRRVVKIDADATLALAKAGYTKKEIERLLAAINDEGVKVKFTAAEIGGHPTQRGTTNADGNVYENHQAEIAPGGAWRLWAEPETGGEAYIPLAQSKRGRSMAIFEQVAQKFGVGLMPFADGGTTVRMTGSSDFGNLPAIIQALAQANVGKMIAAGMLSGPMNPGLAGALSFAMSQRGKPYGWGAVGPSAYDCSGFMSAITNVALGRNPYSRLGSTASFPWGMFTAGPGAFTIGSTKAGGIGGSAFGHMAGTINGTNVESRGTDGVVVGPNARGANSGMFATRAHLKGFADGGIEGDGPFDQLDPRGMYFGRGFRYGTDHVPWDGMYKLHRGEQVSNTGAVKAQTDAMIAMADRPPDLDYARLGREVAKAMGGMHVKLDGRAVGAVQGAAADRLGRAG